MGVPMTEESSGSEVYTTSARVARHVNTSALSSTALTEIILEAQNEVDSMLSDDFTVPFTAGSVPDIIADATTDLAIGKVIMETLSRGLVTAGDNNEALKFFTNARMKVDRVNDGQYDTYIAGVLLNRTTSRQTVSIVDAATPAATMTIVSGMDGFDLRNYRLMAICTATSGSPTGLMMVAGTMDAREQVSETIYFDGQREIPLDTRFQFVTGVTKPSPGGLTGGTTPLFALKGVRNTGKAFAGGRRAG